MRQRSQTDPELSTEDVLAPVLAVAVAAILGLAALHFNPGLARGSLAPKAARSFSHVAHR